MTGVSLARGGRTTYGHVLGVLMLDTTFPRPVGDIGNALTWPFPVLHRVIEGASPERILGEDSRGFLEPFVAGARELEAAGVELVTTSCGYLAEFQGELARAVSVPVVSSSLVQVPLVSALIGADRRVGVLTISDELGERHFSGCSVDSEEVVVEVMEPDTSFVRAHTVSDHASGSHDLAVWEAEAVAAARTLRDRHPEVGAVVLECTNLVPFAPAIRREVGVPVYDIHTAVMWGLSGRRLNGPWSEKADWNLLR